MNKIAEIKVESASAAPKMDSGSTAELCLDQPDRSCHKFYVARQPIFDINSNVFAYELLFRTCETNAASFVDGNEASSQVILNAFVVMGIESITENRQVFVNLTRDFIVGKLALPLNPDQLVVEILEDIEIDDEVVEAVGDLKDKGYTVALDDYIFTEDKAPLFDKIDIIKIDLPECDLEKMAPELEVLKDKGIKLLAEKVETHEEYELCKALGFDYFQGYYFSKPKIMSRQSIKPNRLSIIQVLAMLQDPNCEISKLEELISRDVAISYKLLRIINSALYNLPNKIESVRQAIVALGLKTIREWMNIVILTDIDDKPRELITLSLQRGRMMRSLAEVNGLDPETGFITGLFSLIDAFMDQPMEEIIKELPLSDEIIEALVSMEGEYGELLNVVVHYERGDWSSLPASGEAARKLATIYLNSVKWSDQLFQEIGTRA
jgi:EAL and modified HD-GYP domain-containing signal transduction protein